MPVKRHPGWIRGHQQVHAGPAGTNPGLPTSENGHPRRAAGPARFPERTCADRISDVESRQALGCCSESCERRKPALRRLRWIAKMTWLNSLLELLARIWIFVRRPLRLLFRRNIVDWYQIDKAVDALFQRMKKDGYTPSCICCTGRGGAILGALLAFRFDHVIPTIVIHVEAADRMYADRRGGVRQGKTGKIHDCWSIGSNLKNVLLFHVDVVSGRTIEAAIEALTQSGAKISGLASLFWHPNDPEIRASFTGKVFFLEQRPERVRYPWTQPG